MTEPLVLGPIPKFNGLAPFKPEDLEGNFKKLMDAALIGIEKHVDHCIRSFTISGQTTEVGNGKRKSALFVAYLTWMSSRTLAAYQNGEEVAMTDYGRELTKLFFGKGIVSDPEAHPVPAALLQPGATVQINWVQAEASA